MSGRFADISGRFLVGLLLVALVQTTTAANLWDGEEMRMGAGYPFISKFLETEKDAPLVVFIPGARSLARIAYGGHEGSLEEDFLAYWLGREGYNFLGISYPVLTDSGAFDEAHPDITVRAWGHGSAEITRAIMQEHGLTGPVIATVWSMAGKSVQPYAEAARRLGIDLDFHVSLAATPPLPNSVNMGTRVSMHDSGLALRQAGAPAGVSALAANARENGRTEIIPADVFNSSYLGHWPAQLLGGGLRYDGELHTIYRDHWADMQDTKFYATDYPLVAMIVPGQQDPRHALMDRATWGYINSNTLFFGYAGGEANARNLPEERFNRLQELVRDAHSRLAIDIGGNHFFFVGEKGARETAAVIRELERRVHRLKAELAATIADGAGTGVTDPPGTP